MTSSDMSTERHVAWPGLPELDGRVELQRLHWRDGTLTLELTEQPSGRSLLAVFVRAACYSHVDEFHYNAAWQRAPVPYQGLHVVEGSMWLTWIRLQAGGTLDDAQLTHYAVWCADDCVDVATDQPPTFHRVTTSP